MYQRTFTIRRDPLAGRKLCLSGKGRLGPSTRRGVKSRPLPVARNHLSSLSNLLGNLGSQNLRFFETIETLRQPVAAFNAHDLDAVMRFFADDCELVMPRGPNLRASGISVKKRSERDWLHGSKVSQMCTMEMMSIGFQESLCITMDSNKHNHRRKEDQCSRLQSHGIQGGQDRSYHRAEEFSERMEMPGSISG